MPGARRALMVGMEEQIALTVACEGRIMGIDPSWNLVPQWDKPEAPGGVLHFTGPEKPWNAPWLRCAAWWQAQHTTWEQLRSGEWEDASLRAISLRGRDGGWSVGCKLA